MGKIVKFFLKVILFLFILGIVMGLIEQFGGILIAIVAIVAVVAVVTKSSNKSSQSTPAQEPPKPAPAPAPAPEPVKKAEKDEIEKLYVDMED